MTRDKLIQAFAGEGYTDWFPDEESYTLKVLYERIGLSYLTFLKCGIVVTDSDLSYMVEYKDIESVIFYKVFSDYSPTITVRLLTSISSKSILPNIEIHFKGEDTIEKLDEFLEVETCKPRIVRYSTEVGVKSLLYVRNKMKPYGILGFLGTFEQHSSLVEFWNKKVNNNELRY